MTATVSATALALPPAPEADDVIPAVELPVRGAQIEWRGRARPEGEPVLRVAVRDIVRGDQVVHAYVGTRTIRVLHLAPDGTWYVWDQRFAHHPGDAERARRRIKQVIAQRYALVEVPDVR